jgi:hypothetical protein
VIDIAVPAHQEPMSALAERPVAAARRKSFPTPTTLHLPTARVVGAAGLGAEDSHTVVAGVARVVLGIVSVESVRPVSTRQVSDDHYCDLI